MLNFILKSNLEFEKSIAQTLSHPTPSLCFRALPSACIQGYAMVSRSRDLQNFDCMAYTMSVMRPQQKFFSALSARKIFASFKKICVYSFMDIEK